jgi:arylsulfatase A-like enzyme
MAAVGPDFKQGYDDGLPASNADIAPTLAQILGLPLPAKGRLQGRVLSESLIGGGPSPAPATVKHLKQYARPAPSGLATVLEYQEYEGRKYFDSAGLVRGALPKQPGGSSAQQHESH